MWKSIKTGRKTFIFKRSASKGTLRLIVSDFIRIWVNEMTDIDLLALIQEQNPLLELGEDFPVQTIWTIVDNHLESKREEDGSSRSSLDLNITDDSPLHFRFNGKMHGLPIKLNIILIQENSHILFNEVTSPLLSLSQVLLAQQDHLFSLLEKKDLEISQYKLEGATLSRRNIQTPSFNKNEFLSSHQDIKSSLSEELSKVVDVLNLVSQQKPKSSERDIPNESAGISETAQIPSATDVRIKAANQEQDTKTTVLRLPKKKRTKLNI